MNNQKNKEQIIGLDQQAFGEIAELQITLVNTAIKIFQNNYNKNQVLYNHLIQIKNIQNQKPFQKKQQDFQDKQISDMKSQSVLSEQENYQDGVEEFSNQPYNKKSNKMNGTKVQIEENNPCDETMGYIQIVDEYENVDKFKRIPRNSEYQCKDRRVQLPSFTVKGNPFVKNELNGILKENEIEYPPAIITLGTPQQSQNDYIKHQHNGKNGIHHKNNKINGSQQKISIQISAAAGVSVSGESPHQKNLYDSDQYNSRGNKVYDSRYEDSIQEDNVDNEIIFQIADQIPELLEKSEMRDACLTPSVYQELKQQNHKIQEKKSDFAKAKSFHKEADEKEEEEENLKMQENKVDAKSQMVIDSSNNDLLKQQLEQQKKKQQEKEEQEQIKLMEGYESDPPALPEDKNVIYTLVKKEFQFHNKKISKQMIFDLVRDFKIIQAKDECRAESSHSDGGKECKDKKIKECLRGIGKEIISQVGRKILSGSFNLTQISFPIKAMIPKSALEKALYSTCLFPLYINKACQTDNYVERFKYLICATFGNFYINCGFLKPLNPIIGETCQGFYPDGTRLYAEQISHHPPISYFTIYGPDKSYLMYGNYNYKSNAGLNSLKLKNNGNRHIKFKDGQYIIYNFAKEVYSGSFMGAMRVESAGSITFKDEANDIVAEIAIDSVKKRPTDYISGTIKVKGQVVSKCYGTYLGFIEFDDVRYWDYRYVLPYEPIIIKSTLGSDQSQRPDKIYLQKGDIPKAQKFKEELEELQRKDANLRKKQAEKKGKEQKEKDKQEKQKQKEKEKEKKKK
ncbi:hypothetical protein ABPG74_017155 [Tetrahymena malaccensis]